MLCPKHHARGIQIHHTSFDLFMKLLFKGLLLVFMTICYTATTYAQSEADRLLGTYMSAGNKGRVVISKDGDKYKGTLVWSVTPGALDKNNPDPAERTKKLAGKVILKNFVYAGKNVWDSGTIYDPEKGKTYSCKITLKPDGNLTVRGFIGVSLIGRNTEWTRVK